MGRLRIAAIVAVLIAGGVSQLVRANGFDSDPTFPVGPISDTVSHQVPELERAAASLAGRKTVVVNCWSTADWKQLQVWAGNHHEAVIIDALGITSSTTHRIQLSPVVCQTLAQVIARSARQPLFTAYAVTVLAHESAHASGIQSESRAECRAMETEPRAAELLGIPKAAAVRYQHIYRGTVYPNDLPRYRMATCVAGKPGVLVPDTLGTPRNLRPFEHMAKEISRALPRWRNVGGGGSFGPLSPCAPVRSRNDELARFGETFLGPRHDYMSVTGTILKTQGEYAVALSRFKALGRCGLEERRAEIREFHSRNTVSLRPVPAAIRSLSPRVGGFRILFGSAQVKADIDTINVFDKAKRSMTELNFWAPAGQLPVSVEVRAAKALLGS